MITEDDERIFAQEMRELIESRGIILTSIAAELGVSTGRLSHVLWRQISKIDLSSYKQLCHVLGVPNGYFSLFRSREKELQENDAAFSITAIKKNETGENEIAEWGARRMLIPPFGTKSE